MKLEMKMFLLFLLVLGLAALLLNAYSIYAIEAKLTPMNTHFDPNLPGTTITDHGLNADFFCRKTDTPQKAVIILGGSEGGKHWSTNTANIQRLLDHGYCVMVLAYFHAPGLPAHLREIPLEYFEKAFQCYHLKIKSFPMIMPLSGIRAAEIGFVGQIDQILYGEKNAGRRVFAFGNSVTEHDGRASAHCAFRMPGHMVRIFDGKGSIQSVLNDFAKGHVLSERRLVGLIHNPGTQRRAPRGIRKDHGEFPIFRLLRQDG
jgi:hypothetical protein